MQLDLTAPADNFDADAFTRGVERMLEIIPRNDDVRLDVTTDFRASVRAKHPNRKYAATYESARDMATAMGKTIAQDDGTVDVIVDARVFSLSALPGTPERTLEHEALHIAIGQRGETLHDLRDRSDNPASAYGITLEVAGTACEARAQAHNPRPAPRIQADHPLLRGKARTQPPLPRHGAKPHQGMARTMDLRRPRRRGAHQQPRRARPQKRGHLPQALP
jgi:hypothetical protein